jgi:hypothetical protein
MIVSREEKLDREEIVRDVTQSAMSQFPRRPKDKHGTSANIPSLSSFIVRHEAGATATCALRLTNGKHFVP